MITTEAELDAYCDTLAASGSEHAHQRAFFNWLNTMQHWGKHPMARLAFAIPNGGKRDKITAARLKAEGVKSGVPDICYPLPLHAWHGLYLELKVDKGKTSDTQNSWIIDLRICGYAVATCWGWRAARQAFNDYTAGGVVDKEYT